MYLKWLFFMIIPIRNQHFSFVETKEYHSEVIALLKDFFKAEIRPSVVISLNCWPRDEQLLQLEMFSSINIVSTIGQRLELLDGSYQKEFIFYVLDLNCYNIQDILEKASREGKFYHPYRWMFIGEFNTSLFEKLRFSFDVRLHLAEKLQTDDAYEYRIKSFYKLAENSEIRFDNDLFSWKKEQGLLQLNEFSVSKNRSNLFGRVLNVSYVVTNPNTLNHLEDGREIEVDSLTKVNWILTKHLLSIVNATSQPIIRSTWGYKNETTGLYSGLIGDLQTGRAEFGGTPSFFVMDRLDIVDFIAATTPTYMKFVFRAPPLSYVTNVFTLPFETHVWYCSLALVILTFIVLIVIVKWEWTDPYFRQYIEESPYTLRPEFSEVALMEIGAITQQGSDTVPKSAAGRIATIFTFIILMFLYTSYSANIVAILQSTTNSIRTLEDLLKSRISLGVEDIVYAHYYFENADEPIRRAIYQQKIAPKGQKPNFMSLEEGIQRVQKGFFAFHVELSRGYKVVSDIFQENEKCALTEIAFVNLMEPWVPMKKNSPYKKTFKIGMHIIQESGLQKREFNRIYMKKPVCHSKGNNFESVGIIDCSGAFIIFAVGVLLSLFIFLLENWVEKYRSKGDINTFTCFGRKEKKGKKEKMEKKENIERVGSNERDIVQYDFVN